MLQLLNHTSGTEMTKKELEPAFIALSELPKDTSQNSDSYQLDKNKLIAFYLPQYHRVAENSEWWGPGFTEWTNVARGKPNFDGHYQPHIPRELGFYDLTYQDTLHEQADMAKLYGVHGFCFYYYWFSGKRILEKPLENFLSSDVDINFCCCWANENWTRTWDGASHNILLGQNYSDEDDEKFIDSLLPYFQDSRYILVEGKPLLVVYRAKELPSASKSFAKWRALAKKKGFKGLHIAVVDFYDIDTPNEVDADALIEFPPHKFNWPQNVPTKVPEFSNKNFTGSLIDYTKIIAQSMCRAPPPFKLYRGIIPSWDNTARRQNNPTIVVNASPELYGEWLRYLRAYTRAHNSEESDNFIFINAWNEWGEGCHLEPDIEWGLSYLEQTLKSSYYIDQGDKLNELRSKLLINIARIQSENLQISPEFSANETKTDLLYVRPASGTARKLASVLRSFPLLYSVCRKVYRRLRG